MTLRIKGATTIKGLTSVNWSPNLLFAAGEQGVWYDPSDFSTMFQDTAGTTPVTATGQSVARINDKSGNNNHATQSTAASRPTLQIDGNGKYYLSFDGSNDWLSTSSINMTATDAVTVWAGIRKNANTNGMACEFGTGAGGNTGGFALIAPSLAGDDFYWRTYGTSIVNINYVAASPVTAVINASAKISTPVSTLRFNGTQVATSTSSQGTGNYNNYVLYVGTRDGTQIYLNGRIYGLIIRGVASTASQISMTETYMNSKTAAY